MKWTYRGRGQGWKPTLEGESTEGERKVGKEEGWRGNMGGGVWLPLLTAIDFL